MYVNRSLLITALNTFLPAMLVMITFDPLCKEAMVIFPFAGFGNIIHDIKVVSLTTAFALLLLASGVFL